MRVLVAVASKHGATLEIGAAVMNRLRERGLEANLRSPEEVRDLTGYDAVVIGSAVYAGRWLEPARVLVGRHGGALAKRPVWLFSSGPLGDPPLPADAPHDATAMAKVTGAVDHRVFAGRLDRELLGIAERAVVRALRAPEGDFRDFAEISEWSDDIADVLQAQPAVTST